MCRSIQILHLLSAFKNSVLDYFDSDDNNICSAYMYISHWYTARTHLFVLFSLIKVQSEVHAGLLAYNFPFPHKQTTAIATNSTSLPWFPPSLHLHAARTAKGLAVGEPTQLSSRSSGIQLRLLPRHDRRALTCRTRPIAIKVTIWSAYNGDNVT